MKNERGKRERNDVYVPAIEKKMEIFIEQKRKQSLSQRISPKSPEIIMICEHSVLRDDVSKLCTEISRGSAARHARNIFENSQSVEVTERASRGRVRDPAQPFGDERLPALVVIAVGSTVPRSHGYAGIPESVAGS